MARVVVTENVSLDGVMQSPGDPQEDTRGGFTKGAWANLYADEVMGEEMGRGMASTGAMLFGRLTYEKFFRVWHGRDDGNPFTPHLDAVTKYVVSGSLTEPLPWDRSVLVSGGLQQVARLKDELDGNLSVVGSGALVRSLEAAGMVDEYVLLIHPLLLGQGTRLYAAADSPTRPLRLVRSRTTTTGVLIATYQPSSSPEPTESEESSS